MVGKQGFIRTLEAVIAILLVLGFLLYVLPKVPALAEPTVPEGIDSARNFILTEFSTNEIVRGCVSSLDINHDTNPSSGSECEKAFENSPDCKTSIVELLDKHTVPGFNYHCEICDDEAPCTQVLSDENRDKSIYPGTAFIYFTGTNVKYVRVYFWRK